MLNKTITKAITILSLIAIPMTMVACAPGGVSDERFEGMSTNEIIAAYQSLEGKYSKAKSDLENLESTMAALSSDDSLTSAVSAVGDGTDRLTFNSVDSKIIFPSSFQYPGAEAVAPSSKIDIVNNVSVATSSTWTIKLNGSTLELEHSSGISGIIKVGMITESYEAEMLKSDVISPWFESIPESQVKYKDIFIDDSKMGCQAETPTMIDSEDAYLKCGMVAYGEYSVTYVFVYRGNQDSTKDESVMSVLNSIIVNDGKVSINN